MNPFEQYTPTSLPEAFQLLARLDGEPRLIAGGTDLMLKMKAGVVMPTAVINIKRLPELRGISYDPATGLRLGALTTLRELNRSPLVQTHYPCLAQAASWMASEQIRTFATVGGNLCNASPSADLAPALIALDAVATLTGAAASRQIPLAQFFTGPGRSALQPGELLQEVLLPPPQGHTVYYKQSPRDYMDIAVVGVAVRLQMADGQCTDAWIVLGAVAPTPLRVSAAEAVLRGRPLTPNLLDETAQAAAAASAPIDDLRSSAWYRRQMVRVVTRRALEQFVS